MKGAGLPRELAMPNTESATLQFLIRALINGTIFEDFFSAKLAAKDYFQLGGISYGEKGLDLKNVFVGPIRKIEIFNAFLFMF